MGFENVVAKGVIIGSNKQFERDKFLLFLRCINNISKSAVSGWEVHLAVKVDWCPSCMVVPDL